MVSVVNSGQLGSQADAATRKFDGNFGFDAQENQRMKKLLSQRERDIAILKQLESGLISYRGNCKYV